MGVQYQPPPLTTSLTDGDTSHTPDANVVFDQLALKAPLASPTFTGTITTPLTATRAVATGAGGALAASATTSTELGYVNGVTSAIQTQMDLKAPLASPALTGTVGIKGTGTPGIELKDDDCTDDDVNASLTVNATTTTSGAEDIDISIKTQIAGVLTEVLLVDASTTFVNCKKGFVF